MEKSAQKALFSLFSCIYQKIVVTLRPKIIYGMKHSYLLVLIALLLLSFQPTVSPLDDETLLVPADANTTVLAPCEFRIYTYQNKESK